MAGIVEKVFSAKAGETVTVKPDRILVNDVLSVGCFEGVEKVADADKVLIVCDHGVPVPGQRIPGTNEFLGDHERTLNKFAEKFALKYVFGKTIAYQQLAKELAPGSLVVGLGRNIGTMGINGALGLPISLADMRKALETGEVEVKVPACYKVKLTGKLNAPATVRDVAYTLVARLDADAICGKVLVYCGEAVAAMTDGEKFALLNLAADLGAVSAVVADCDCDCSAVFDISEVVPVVVLDGSMKNVVPVSELQVNEHVTNFFIGGCGAGYIEDLRAAAEVLKGKKVAYGARVVVSPVDNETYYKAMEEGLVNIFYDAGTYFMNPGCMNCIGIGAGKQSPNEVALSTGSFNHKGCTGDPSSKVYLASARTVAKGCLTGYVSKELEG